jgi:hypothetical protein
MKNVYGETITPKQRAREILDECINGVRFNEMLIAGTTGLTSKQKIKVQEQIDKIKMRINRILSTPSKVEEEKKEENI